MMAAAKNDGTDDGAERGTGDRGSRAPPHAQRPAMTYTIRLEEDHLAAELAYCETVAEMHSFLRAVVRNSTRSSSILIRVRASKPVFHVERDGLVEYFREIARQSGCRVGLLADTPDLRASHEYLELIARQRGVNVRSFRSRVEALLWFRDRRGGADRRVEAHPELRSGADRRHGGDRRGRGPAAD
jgi:hypothetical protein